MSLNLCPGFGYQARKNMAAKSVCAVWGGEGKMFVRNKTNRDLSKKHFFFSFSWLSVLLTVQDRNIITWKPEFSCVTTFLLPCRKMTARVFLSFASAAAAERTHFALGYACASLLLPYSEGRGGGRGVNRLSEILRWVSKSRSPES
jgi:hypothetical protein